MNEITSLLKCAQAGVDRSTAGDEPRREGRIPGRITGIVAPRYDWRANQARRRPLRQIRQERVPGCAGALKKKKAGGGTPAGTAKP